MIRGSRSPQLKRSVRNYLDMRLRVHESKAVLPK